MRSIQRGSTALLASALAAAVLTCTAAAVAGGRVLADQRRAAAAADLAALAGAAALQRGLPGCPAAKRIAGLNDGTVTDCRVDGEEVRVIVRTESVQLFGRSIRPEAEARAGPTR